MKKVIVAIQSTLVREAVIGALKKRGFLRKSRFRNFPIKWLWRATCFSRTFF